MPYTKDLNVNASLNHDSQGRIQDFYGGGGPRGGAEEYVPARALRARNRTHFRQGSRTHLRALEALGLF